MRGGASISRVTVRTCDGSAPVVEKEAENSVRREYKEFFTATLISPCVNMASSRAQNKKFHDTNARAAFSYTIRPFLVYTFIHLSVSLTARRISSFCSRAPARRTEIRFI